MNPVGRRALELLGASWIVFGCVGILSTIASLAEHSTSLPGWPFTVVVSIALILAGYGVLTKRVWGPWVAVAAVAGALAESIAWLAWTWTPILIATVIFHLYGLAVLLAAGFSSAPKRPDA